MTPSPPPTNAIGLPARRRVRTSTRVRATFVALLLGILIGTLVGSPFAATSTPAASSNLAYQKPATASSLQSSSYPASNAVDGSPSTRWSSAYSDPQWIRVDLGSTYVISEVKLTWEAAYGKAYLIQVSADA